MYLSTQGKLHYLLYPSLCLPPPPPLHPLPHAHYTLTSHLPPISTVTDDEACEPLRLPVASLSSLRAAARLLQQLEHNQVGLRAAATHTVAIPAPRGSGLHLCVYSDENLNQTTTYIHTRTPPPSSMIGHRPVTGIVAHYGRHLDTGPALRGHVCWLLCRRFYSPGSHSLRGIIIFAPSRLAHDLGEGVTLSCVCMYVRVC